MRQKGVRDILMQAVPTGQIREDIAALRIGCGRRMVHERTPKRLASLRSIRIEQGKRENHSRFAGEDLRQMIEGRLAARLQYAVEDTERDGLVCRI
jgi:hypothetical protein